MAGQAPGRPNHNTPSGVPVDNVAEERDWFVAGQTRDYVKQRALNLLRHGKLGEFIVRDVASSPGCLGLTVKTGGHELVNYLIQPYSGGVTVRGTKESFATLSLLIAFYSATKRPSLPCRLLDGETSNHPDSKNVALEEANKKYKEQVAAQLAANESMRKELEQEKKKAQEEQERLAKVAQEHADTMAAKVEKSNETIAVQLATTQKKLNEQKAMMARHVGIINGKAALLSDDTASHTSRGTTSMFTAMEEKVSMLSQARQENLKRQAQLLQYAVDGVAPTAADSSIEEIVKAESMDYKAAKKEVLLEKRKRSIALKEHAMLKSVIENQATGLRGFGITSLTGCAWASSLTHIPLLCACYCRYVSLMKRDVDLINTFFLWTRGDL